MTDNRADDLLEQEIKDDFSRWAPDAFEEGLRRCFGLDWVDENGRVEVLFRVQLMGLGPHMCQLRNENDGRPTIPVRAADEPIDDECIEDFIYSARQTFEEALREDFRFDEQGRIEFELTAELASRPHPWDDVLPLVH